MSAPQPPDTPGNPDPWSQPPEVAAPAPPPADLLTSPAEAGGPRRGRLPILLAAATVVAVLLGAVAYAGVRLWYGSGAQPEEAAPSTVLAFARIDLSPGYGQRRKIDNLLKQFPAESGKDAVDELKRGIFRGLDIDEAAYRRHVEPWFAERVGIALWMLDNRPYRLLTLATGNESAARSGLAELQRMQGADEFGFLVRNGYALVAHGERDSQAAAEAAGEDVARESLAASARFRQGVDWLPAQQTALAWGDLTGLGAAMKAATEWYEPPVSEDELRQAPHPLAGGIFPGGLLPGGLLLGMPGSEQWGDLKGHVVVGAEVTDSGVEIRFRGFGTGVPARGAPTDARSTVDSLPGNSAIAGSFRVGDFGARLADLIPPSGEQMPPEEQALPEELARDLPPGETEALEEARRAGERFLAVGKALSALANAKISIAVSDVREGEIPALTASAETTSAQNAAALAEAARLLGGEVTVTTSGNRVEVTTKGYAAGEGTLAGQGLYREALADAPAQASAIVYLDVQRVLAGADLTESERARAEPVKAVALAAGTEGGDPVGLLRVIIR